MQRNLAVTKPTFQYQFSGVYNELMSLHKAYRDLVIDKDKHEQDEDLHDKRWDRIGCYTGQNSTSLRLEQEALQLRKSTLQKAGFNLQTKIEYLAKRILAHYNEMVIEMGWDDSELSKGQFAGYLLCYKEVLETGKGLEIYKTKPFEEIMEAIKINIPNK